MKKENDFSKDEDRRKCPSCKAPFVSEKRVMVVKEFVVSETNYLCGSEVSWSVNCETVSYTWLKDCPKKSDGM